MPTPNEGGCWFCNGTECDEYDSEFDTDLHTKCLIDALEKGDDPAAECMSYLLVSIPSSGQL